MRASSDGTATPVDGRCHDQVDVAGLQPRVVERAQQRLAPELHGVLEPRVVGFAEVAERQVVVHRQDEMAAVDLGARVQFTHDGFVTCEGRDLHEPVGDLLLAVSVRRQRAVDSRDDAHGAHSLGTGAGARWFNDVAGLGHGFGTLA